MNNYYLSSIDIKNNCENIFDCKLTDTYIKKAEPFSIFSKANGAKEVAVYQISKSGHNCTYDYVCDILFVLSKMASTKDHKTNVLATDTNGKKIVMSENLEEFRKQVKTVKHPHIKILIGDEYKTEFEFCAGKIEGSMVVSSSVFKPEDISSSNVLKMLKGNINQVLIYLDLEVNFNKKVDKYLCL